MTSAMAYAAHGVDFFYRESLVECARTMAAEQRKRPAVRQLLSTNTKLEKTPASDTRYLVRGLALAPHTQGGRNVCPWAGACVAACVLWFAGRTVMKNVRDAMIARARWFFSDRPAFLAALAREIEALVRAADRAGAVPVVRLNVASDIVWERVAPELLARFPGVRFFDYTKAPPRARPTTPANYTLTHSFHERMTLADVAEALSMGRNIAVVFDSIYHPQRERFGALPSRVVFTDGSGAKIECPVICGDAHDVRLTELDGRGVVVGLAGKGGAARVAEALAAGFVQSAGEVGRVVRWAPWVHASAVAVVRCAG